MTLSKLLKFVFGLLILFSVAVGLTSINHPIILKWLTGSARHFGKSIPATIYSNGQVNDKIKIFHTDEANNYLLSLAEYDSAGRLKFLNINLNKKTIGKTAGISKKDYDFIAGHLFQRETFGQFSPFQDGINALDFEPQFSSSDKQIKFNVPPNILKFDSVRIILH